ncbi:hypothetical protein ACLBW2_17085 [Enterobacteriaceae bacterium C23F]
MEYQRRQSDRLHNQEIEAVSRADAIADTGAAIGKQIGSVVEGLFGKKQTFTALKKSRTLLR